MSTEKFSIKRRLKSFVYAYKGLTFLLKYEHNTRIHLIVAVCVFIAGFLLKITKIEWIAIIFAIGFVFSAEIFNTSIEHLADVVYSKPNIKIKIVKDLGSAAVLVAAITAAIVWLIVFLPIIFGMIE